MKQPAPPRVLWYLDSQGNRKPERDPAQGVAPRRLTVRSIAEFHAEHDRQASLYQRTIERLIHQLGQPAALVVIGVIIILWIGMNMVLRQSTSCRFADGKTAVTKPPA